MSKAAISTARPTLTNVIKNPAFLFTSNQKKHTNRQSQGHIAGSITGKTGRTGSMQMEIVKTPGKNY